MVLNVNLLKRKRSISEKQYQLENKFFRYSLVFVFVVIAITVSLFVWQFATSRSLVVVQSELTQAEARLEGLKDASVRQLYLKSRLKLIEAYFGDSVASRDALQNLYSLDLPGVVIVNASFESETLLSINVQADSVITLENVFLYFQETDAFFTQAVNGGVIRVEDGTYTMKVDLTVPQGVSL